MMGLESYVIWAPGGGGGSTGELLILSPQTFNKWLVCLGFHNTFLC
jgi:hypothetical protein